MVSSELKAARTSGSKHILSANRLRASIKWRYFGLRRRMLEAMRPKITDWFHFLYYHSSDSWRQNTYLGYPISQYPGDLFLYQELIFRKQPVFVIQTGVFKGGSIMYFAKLLDSIGAPESALVIGIDIALSDQARSLSHPRIRLIEGDSVSAGVLSKVKTIVGANKGMVILDSDHAKDHVLEELRAYKDFVGEGDYLIVEDTNLNGHPVDPFFGPGPMEAVREFLKEDRGFARDDLLWQRSMFSYHQFGWLQRIS